MVVYDVTMHRSYTREHLNSHKGRILMKSYINDSPIETADDDQFGVSEFARALATSFIKIKNPVGTTIALHGPWGSGKSSVVNLVRDELTENNGIHNQLIVNEFKCWWYRGEEALALGFLQNLHSILSKDLKAKISNLVPKIGRNLLQAGPVLSSAIALTPAAPFSGIVGAFTSFANRFFPDEDTVEKSFHKLSEALASSKERVLIIIDDIDRLSSDEALAIFRLVKSVGRLPNVMYLLVFDKKLAEKAITEKYPSEGPHFLEKIIQASFELPYPLQEDLNNAVMTAVTGICGEPEEQATTRFMNLFYDIVVPYIELPRDVTRLKNSISVSWPAIAQEVNLGDFIALETIRLYEPSLYAAIRANKDLLCGNRAEGDPNPNDDQRFDRFLAKLPQDSHEKAKLALQRLFPRLERMGYGGEWLGSWKSERRVCIESVFDTYFRLTLSQDILPAQTLAELISKAGDTKFIKNEFKEAAEKERRNKRSLVPVYLAELTAHAKKIQKKDVLSLLTGLFEVHDEIDLEKDADKGFMAYENTTLRYHWLIRRLTEDRFNIDERTEMYLTALQSASLRWHVDFTMSAIDDYEQKENRPPTREEDCLVRSDALPRLKEHALNSIQTAAKDGSLIRHKDLLWLLYRWNDLLDDDPSEVKAWTREELNKPSSLVALAKSMTGESWSAGMGGFGFMGDRVATRTVQAKISEDTPIIDAQAFRKALESLMASNDVSIKDSEAIREFIDAWNQQAERKQ